MDNLSSKYMLPVGGMLTAVFVVKKWGVTNFLKEIGGITSNPRNDKIIIKLFCYTSAIIVGFIILNEIISKVTGAALVG